MIRQLIRVIEAQRRIVFLIGVFLALFFLMLSTHFGVQHTESVRLDNITINNSANSHIQFLSELDKSNLTNVQGYEISFKGKALESNYGNFFQTDDGQNAIRLELNKPNDLSLIFFDNSEGIFKVTEKLSLNDWHDVRLVGEKNQFIKLFIDSKLVFYANSKFIEIYRDGNTLRLPPNIKVNDIKADFGTLAIGTGFSRGRDLVGEVSDFNIRIDFIPMWNLWNILAVGILLLLLAAQTLLTIKRLCAQKTSDTSPAIHQSMRLTSVLLLTVFAGNYIAGLGSVYQKWLPFLLVGSTIGVFPWIARLGDEWHLKPKMISFILDLLAPFLLIVFIVGGLQIHYLKIGIAATIFMFGAIFIVSVYAAIEIFSNQFFKNWKYFLWIVILGVASWVAVLELPNWINWNLAIQRSTPYAVVISLIIFIVLIEEFFYCASDNKKDCRWRVAILFTLILGAFSFLSYRFDTLFLGSSEYHWEYFVGPIRGLREGGWLLWDTPSQYGFLNILVASILPLKNSWQALYVFQGSLLLLVSVLYYLTLCRCVSKRYIFNFFIVVLTIYLADPSFIGPQLYPSSSVFRFLWCYLIFFLIVNLAFQNTKPIRFFWSCLPMWIFGCLWSFESAIYSSAICLLAAFAYLFSIKISPREDFVKRLFILIRVIFAAVLFLSLILLIISIYYKIRIGVYPDFRMFYEYALTYGGGFGEIPISKFGSIWIYILLFSGVYGTIFFINMRRQDSYYDYIVILGSLGIILSLSTYLIGRAHASNVTAVLPLISLLLVTGLASSQLNYFRNAPLYAIGFPIIFISLSGGLVQPSSIEILKEMKSFSTDISDRLRLPESNLAALIDVANITPDNYIAYYGFHAAMPIYMEGTSVKSYEKTWVLNPFQLLEEPISAKRREEVAMRSLSNRLQKEGYLIQAKGQFEDRFSDWKKIISKYYLIENEFENKDYVIFHLIKR